MTALAKQPTPALTPSAARTLTDEVKADALALQDKCLQLYEDGAHIALGYGSWGDYWRAEFGGGKSHGYRMVEAGRVRRALAQSPIGDSQPNEGQARELARLDDEQAQRQAWEAAIERAKEEGRSVTASDVRSTVDSRRPKAHPDPERPAGKSKPEPPQIEPPEAGESEPEEATPNAAPRLNHRPPPESSQSWPSTHREERVETACRIIREQVNGIAIEADPGRWLRCFTSLQEALASPVKRANAAASEAVEADRLGIEQGEQ